MYGTIARLKVKPGKLQDIANIMDSRAGQIPGLNLEAVIQTDADPQTLYLVVGFDSRESYEANAASPEQHESYLQYRQLLEEDPEWHDGAFIGFNRNV